MSTYLHCLHWFGASPLLPVKWTLWISPITISDKHLNWLWNSWRNQTRIKLLLLREETEKVSKIISLSWVTHCLTDRLQYVRLGSGMSDLAVCSTGTPQVTVPIPIQLLSLQISVVYVCSLHYYQQQTKLENQHRGSMCRIFLSGGRWDPSTCTAKCWRLSVSQLWRVQCALLRSAGGAASDTKRLNKLMRKAWPVSGCKLHSVKLMVETRLLSKPVSIETK